MWHSFSRIFDVHAGSDNGGGPADCADAGGYGLGPAVHARSLACAPPFTRTDDGHPVRGEDAYAHACTTARSYGFLQPEDMHARFTRLFVVYPLRFSVRWYSARTKTVAVSSFHRSWWMK